MIGIDEEFALLKMVRADLSVKRKKSNDEAQAIEASYARAFAGRQLLAYAYN